MTIGIPELVEEVIAQIEAKNRPDKEWDDFVPIKKSKDDKKMDVFLFEHIEVPAIYAKLVYELLTAESDVIVDIHINNGGGYIDAANSIVYAIANSKANITAHLSGTVASAATVIALACPTIIIEPDLNFMCHEASFQGVSGKFSDMKTFQTFYDRHTKESSIRHYEGFLTKAEIEEMHRGKEHWFNAKETKQRILNRKAFLAGTTPSISKPTRGRPKKG